MKQAGFHDRSLGKIELQAKQEAIRLNTEWDKYRFGEHKQPCIMVYPPAASGVLTAAQSRCVRPSARRRASLGAGNRKRVMTGLAPGAGLDRHLVITILSPMVSEDLLALRAKVAERVSESEAFERSRCGVLSGRSSLRSATRSHLAPTPHCRSQFRSCPTARGLVAPRRFAARAARMARAVFRIERTARRRMGHDAVADRRAFAHSRPASQ